MPKKSKKNNGECLELKNINYQSMLLKNKIVVDNQEQISSTDGVNSDTKMYLLIDRIHDLTNQNN